MVRKTGKVRWAGWLGRWDGMDIGDSKVEGKGSGSGAGKEASSAFGAVDCADENLVLRARLRGSALDKENTGGRSGSGESSEVYTAGVKSKTKGSLLGNSGQGAQTIFENLTWLTSSEAAEYLRLPSVGTLRVMVFKRRLPFYRIGRNLRFKKSELDRLLDLSRNGGI